MDQHGRDRAPNACNRRGAPLIAIEHSDADKIDNDEYLRGLQLCFPDWGAKPMFDWCFRRRVAGLLPDLLIARDEASGPMLAGSAVTYRTACTASGQRFIAAIMTGSWTLPAARGNGLFARMIEESKHAAAAKGAQLLLAFVGEQNASRRRLEAAGAIMHPTSYCRTLPAAELRNDLARTTDSGPVETPIRNHDLSGFSRPRGGTQFVYSEPEWRAQFIDRPIANGIICVQPRDAAWRAIVEETGEFDRVHAIEGVEAAIRDEALRALVNRATQRNRRLFVFTTAPAHEATLASAGFEMLRGCLAILPIGSRAMTIPSDWNLENGDRM